MESRFYEPPWKNLTGSNDQQVYKICLYSVLLVKVSSVRFELSERNFRKPRVREIGILLYTEVTPQEDARLFVEGNLRNFSFSIALQYYIMIVQFQNTHLTQTFKSWAGAWHLLLS